MKTFKAFLSLMLALVLCLGVLPAAAQEEQPITITWWSEYTDADLMSKIQEQIIAPFEAANPDIKVEAVGKGDYDRVLQTALATNSGPDIYCTNGPAYSMQFAIDGLAADLTAYSETYNWTANVMDWALDACCYDGKLYSIPTTTETVFLFYNPDMMAENGWEVPTTFDELTAVCDAMMEKGIYPFAFGASDFKAANEWWLTLAFNYYAGRDNVAKALRGEIPWNSPIFVEAVETLNTMWQKGYITGKMSHEITMSDALSLFGEEKAGFVGWATWLLKDLAKYSDNFDFDFTRWPVWNPDTEESLIVGIGSCWAINANTTPEKQDAAARFINFLLEDKERAAALSVTLNGELWIPMEYELTDFPEDTDPKFLRVIEEFNTIPEDAPGLSMWTFWSPSFESYLYENIERVWLNEITAQQLMDEGQMIFEQEFAEGKVPPTPGR